MQHGPLQYLGPDEEAKRAGHIMGIKGGAKIKLSPILDTFIAETEANYNQITSKYIQEKLRQYSPKSHHREWSIIREMFDQTAAEAQEIKYYGPAKIDQIATDQISQYQSGKPVHVCSGWDGHHIGVTFYKGYLLLSNRGEHGSPYEGTIVYKLPRNINKHDLKVLQKVLLQGGVTYEGIKAKITELQGEKVGSFHQNPQKYGTCSYVNKLAATEGLMCLLRLEAQGKLNDRAIRNYIADDDNRSVYKEFTHANRESEVDRMIGLINQASLHGDREQLAVMVNVAFSVASSHHGQVVNPQKQAVEQERARRLLLAIEPHQRFLSSDNQIKFGPLKQVVVRTPPPSPSLPRMQAERGFDDLKKRIVSQFDQHVSIVDRVPGWYLPLMKKVREAQTPDEIHRAFDDSLRNSDPRLTALNQEVRGMLALEANVVQQQWPGVPGYPHQEPVYEKETSEKMFMERIEKNLDPMGLEPKQILPVDDKLRMRVMEHFGKDIDFMKQAPGWYLSLYVNVGRAQNDDDIFAALKTTLNENPHDQKLNILVDSFVRGLIRDAKDINELIRIVERYPRKEIVSDSGSRYRPEDVSAQLKVFPLKLDSVTAALGLRNKVQELQAGKKQLLFAKEVFLEKQMPHSPFDILEKDFRNLRVKDIKGLMDFNNLKDHKDLNVDIKGIKGEKPKGPLR